MFKLRRLLFTAKLAQRCYASQEQKNIVIASAIRTPFLDYLKHGATAITSQMYELTTEAVIKQAALPREDVTLLTSSKQPNVFMNTIQTGLLSKDVTIECYDDSLEALKTAFDKLHNTDRSSIVITRTDSMPAAHFKSLQLTYLNCLSDEEIIPIRLRKKQRQILTVTHDEQTERESIFDIGTALAITTVKNAARLNINPLAHLSIQYSTENFTKLVQKLLESNALNVNDIHRWIILSENATQSLVSELNLNQSRVQINAIAQYNSVAVVLQLIHLAHSLKPRQMACIVVAMKNKPVTVMLLKKCSSEMTGHLPLLTLYTKDPCPLCDALTEELESKFQNEYQLEKVFIDRKENIRFLRLYRYDIPVLFLNGQFLCMHNLNSDLLKRKLEEFKKQKL